MQRPASLDSRVLLRQLRSTGARELVQVSRASHQVRLPLSALWSKLEPLQGQLGRLLPQLPPMSATAQSYAAEVQKAARLATRSPDTVRAHAMVTPLLEACGVPQAHYL